MNPQKICMGCEHLSNPENGHCYMFKESPKGACSQHTKYYKVVKDTPFGAFFNANEEKLKTIIKQ